MTAEPGSLSGLRLSLAGPGRVGSSLARWAASHGARLVRVAGSRPERCGELCRLLGAAAVPVDELDTAGDDLLLVAVPDARLDEVADLLGRRPQAAAALHTAGSRDAAALAPLRRGGSGVGSLHPLKAFPRVLPDPAEAHGVVFAVDGDAAARAAARRLLGAWGGRPLEVPAESRPVYHLAATLAAGGVATLLATSAELARRCGLPPEAAAGYAELARGALRQAAAAERPGAAITGPAARGDLETFRRHLERLASLYPEAAELIVALARETLRRLAAEGPLDAGQRALARWLEAPERPAGG